MLHYLVGDQHQDRSSCLSFSKCCEVSFLAAFWDICWVPGLLESWHNWSRELEQHFKERISNYVCLLKNSTKYHSFIMYLKFQSVTVVKKFISSSWSGSLKPLPFPTHTKEKCLLNTPIFLPDYLLLAQFSSANGPVLSPRGDELSCPKTC